MKFRNLVAATLINLMLLGYGFSEATPWYSDVELNHTYRNAIWLLTQRGYVNGYEDNTFHPMQDVTRMEALKMILASANLESTPDISSDYLNFRDAEQDVWYSDYLKKGVSLGMISGDETGLLRPNDTINRVEALKMFAIANGIQLDEVENSVWYEKYLKFGIDSALITPLSEGDYAPGAKLSRGELSDIIYRFIKHPYTGESQFGKATYYAGRFEGDHTANGEVFAQNDLTAAHLTLPFGTKVKVTNLATNRSVNVRINDRGPYVDGYVIDLSSGAFEKIANLSTGVLNVRIEVLSE